MLDFVVDLRVLVEYSLGMDFPEALCGGYVKCCHSVDMSAIVEISGTSIMTEPSIIVGFLVVVIPVAMVVILVAGSGTVRLMHVIRVVWSFVPILILPVSACRVRSVRRVVVWPIVFPWPWCFSGQWGWLDRVGSRLDLVGCSCGCLVQHVVLTLLDRMCP